MGFNAGAFAGALAQNALGTYERLGEEELRDMQRKKLKKDLADQEALKGYLSDAAQQQNYTGGSDVASAIGQATNVYGADTDTAKTVQGIIANQTPEQQQATLRAYGSAEGVQTPVTTPGALNLSKVGVYKDEAGNVKASNEGTALSQADQYKYALKQAQAAGNTSAIKELLPLKNQMRESDLADSWDNFRNQNLSKLSRIAETGNTDAFIKEAKTHGVTVRPKQNKDGSQTLEHIENGKVVNSYGSLAEAAKAAGPYLMDKLGAEHFGSGKDYAAYLETRRGNDIKAEANTIDREYKGAGGVIDRAYSSGAKGGSGGGGVGAALYKKAEELSKDPNSKFHGKVEQAYEFLKRGFNRDSDKEEWVKTQRDILKGGGGKKEVDEAKAIFFSPENGYAPSAAVNALKSGINPRTNNTFTEADLEDFNRTFPKTHWQDILGPGNAPKPKVTQTGGIPVPR